jgi:AraC-like DNA-binding protein
MSMAIAKRASSANQFTWEQMLHAAFGSVELVQSVTPPLSAHIRQFPIANLRLIEAVSDCKVARRTARNIATDDDEYFILILVRAGRLKITQFGRECELTRDTFGLFHLSSPSFYCHQETTDVLDLKIPASALRPYIRDPYRHVAIARPAHNGIGRVVADLFQSLTEQAAHMPEWALHACAGQMLSVVTTAIECAGQDLPVDSSSVRSALFKKTLAFIEINAGDASLNANAVAKSAGISLRYLQRVFQDHGLSVAEHIRDCRLKRCHDNLLSGGDTNSSVKEIAFKGGFRSPSHFSTVFKRRYGVSPDGLRRTSQSAVG